MVVKLKV
jgi:hypothetical protein